jgi:hypothetical protein
MGPQNGDQLLLVILVILGVGIVSIVGWLVWIFTRPGGWRSPKSQQPDVRPSIAEKTPDSAQSQAPTYFLALTRGLDGWEIYVRGQRYRSLDAVLDVQTRDEVVDAIRALARFAQEYVQRQRGAGWSPTATPGGGVARDSAPPRPSELTPVQASPSRPPYVAAMEGSPRRSPSSPALIPSINLAQEIGEIVDEMLAKSPELQGHAVTLTSGLSGGIVFAVDGKLYREMDEIPHPEIRELIRRATKEWERR